LPEFLFRRIPPANDLAIKVNGHRSPDFAGVMNGIPASRGSGGYVGDSEFGTGDLYFRLLYGYFFGHKNTSFSGHRNPFDFLFWLAQFFDADRAVL